MDAAAIQKLGTSVAKTMLCDLDDIFVGDRLRPLDENKVKELMDSITRVGLLHPISVRVVDQMEIDGESYNVVPILIEGLHRRAALQGLGIKTATCRVLDVDEVGAELIEIAENLHRNDLNKLQRDEQLARWIELTTERLRVSGKLPETREGRPGIPLSVKQDLGIEETDAKRAVKVAGLSDEAKEAARETGLDNNRTALLEAAAFTEPAKQVSALRERHAAKEREKSADAKVLAKESADKIAELLAIHIPTHLWDALKANLRRAKPADILNEFDRLVGVAVFDNTRFGSSEQLAP